MSGQPVVLVRRLIVRADAGLIVWLRLLIAFALAGQALRPALAPSRAAAGRETVSSISSGWVNFAGERRHPDLACSQESCSREPTPVKSCTYMETGVLCGSGPERLSLR